MVSVDRGVIIDPSLEPTMSKQEVVLTSKAVMMTRIRMGFFVPLLERGDCQPDLSFAKSSISPRLHRYFHSFGMDEIVL